MIQLGIDRVSFEQYLHTAIVSDNREEAKLARCHLKAIKISEHLSMSKLAKIASNWDWNLTAALLKDPSALSKRLTEVLTKDQGQTLAPKEAVVKLFKSVFTENNHQALAMALLADLLSASMYYKKGLQVAEQVLNRADAEDPTNQESVLGAKCIKAEAIRLGMNGVKQDFSQALKLFNEIIPVSDPFGRARTWAQYGTYLSITNQEEQLQRIKSILQDEDASPSLLAKAKFKGRELSTSSMQLFEWLGEVIQTREAHIRTKLWALEELAKAHVSSEDKKSAWDQYTKLLGENLPAILPEDILNGSIVLPGTPGAVKFLNQMMENTSCSRETRTKLEKWFQSTWLKIPDLQLEDRLKFFQIKIQKADDGEMKVSFMFKYAKIFHKGLFGVQANLSKALELYQQAIDYSDNLDKDLNDDEYERLDIICRILLQQGEIYESFEQERIPDLEQALSCYKEVLRLDHGLSFVSAIAHYRTAQILREGGIGVAANPESALSHYRDAMKKDYYDDYKEEKIKEISALAKFDYFTLLAKRYFSPINEILSAALKAKLDKRQPQENQLEMIRVLDELQLDNLTELQSLYLDIIRDKKLYNNCFDRIPPNEIAELLNQCKSSRIVLVNVLHALYNGNISLKTLPLTREMREKMDKICFFEAQLQRQNGQFPIASWLYFQVGNTFDMYGEALLERALILQENMIKNTNSYSKVYSAAKSIKRSAEKFVALMENYPYLKSSQGSIDKLFQLLSQWKEEAKNEVPKSNKRPREETSEP